MAIGKSILSPRLFVCLSMIALLILGGHLSEAFAQHGEDTHGDESGSRFSDEPIPLITPPKRPRPLIELGPKFLGTGNINDGFRIPTGAVWTPAFIVFGQVQTGVNALSQDNGNYNFGEVAGNVNLFGNLYLTPTERIVVGFTPLQDAGAFTSYTFFSDPELPEEVDAFNDEPLNFKLRTLFMEGDLIEIFPKADWDDSNALDYYFSVGRQPLSFQDGLLLNESALDMVGLTRASLKIGPWANTRVTGVFAWGDIDRPADASSIENCMFSNCGDDDALLFGLFTETDTRTRTTEIDVAYVLSEAQFDSLDVEQMTPLAGGSGLYVGIGSTRRIGQKNNTFRIVGSMPIGDESGTNRQGILVLEQLAWTPHHTHDWIYINVFAGIGEFRSATRGPTDGAALGGTAGLLFSPAGLGRFGAALGSEPDASLGTSIGYQKFFGNFRRKQLIVEVGARYRYLDEIDNRPVPGRDAAGGLVRYAFAVGARGVITLDAFGSVDFTSIPDVETETRTNFGGRLEVAINL